jgi:23S rRNA (guanine745-N1)-methyltransferase
MKIVSADNLSCPLDAMALVKTVDGKQFNCAAGHSFDIAKQGHVNLLSVQDKRSKDPGDSKDMVLARQRFLNGGIYNAVSDKLNTIIHEDIIARHSNAQYNVLDAGCGEGYYLDRFVRSLGAEDGLRGQDGTCAAIGMDISKHAVLSAAKRNRQNITWVVGTNRKPPVMQGSLDCIICMFGYPIYEAFAAALKPDGIIILVESGMGHLMELREIVYDDVRKQPPPDITTAEILGFTLQESYIYCGKSEALNKKQINDLLLMTPHFFKAKPEKRAHAARLETLNVTIDVSFRVLRRS